jgi:nucleotide-binding universal stress UspA family protein
MSDKHKPYVLVVGTDYSEGATLAFERALQLASEKTGAEVHVVNVLTRLQSDSWIDGAVKPAEAALVSWKEAAARLNSYVNKVTEPWRASGKAPMRVIMHQRLDGPAREVAQLAADLEADLVVVGTHGRTGLARLALGSVAEEVVRLAPCPVLVVRPKIVPEPIPAIEPPCPRCVEARRTSGGAEFWCEQHRARHGQRHTYHQGDRVSSETNMPLVFHA